MATVLHMPASMAPMASHANAAFSLDAADVAHLEELYQPVPNLLSLGFS